MGSENDGINSAAHHHSLRAPCPRYCSNRPTWRKFFHGLAFSRENVSRQVRRNFPTAGPAPTKYSHKDSYSPQIIRHGQQKCLPYKFNM